MDVFVADACTDKTAEEARKAGAITWERNDLARKVRAGLWITVLTAFLIGTATNTRAFAIIMDIVTWVSPSYLKIMNQAFDAGYLVCTSYRNSRIWFQLGKALHTSWFMREAKDSWITPVWWWAPAAVSGSGWMVSSPRIVKGMHGWDFHTLTGIFSSPRSAAHNLKLAMPAGCFDEQPLTFKGHHGHNVCVVGQKATTS